MAELTKNCTSYHFSHVTLSHWKIDKSVSALIPEGEGRLMQELGVDHSTHTHTTHMEAPI